MPWSWHSRIRWKRFLSARSVEITTAAGEATPFAGREFIRTDRLFLRFAVYGTVASAADLSAQLTTRTGATLMTLPVAPMPGAGTRFQMDVPLASIARGDYLIAVTAVHGDEHARALVPVRVLAF